jgi:type II secretory pathway pseudopilin PulG
MKKMNFKKNGGYTIIETMISVSLFLIVVMMAMGALLNANAIHKKSQNMRSIIDSLNFVMEDMSKNLRTGYNYRCYTYWDNGVPGSDRTLFNTPQDCSAVATGVAIVFEQQNGKSDEEGMSDNVGDQWVYLIGTMGVESIENPPGVFRSTKGGDSDTFVRLTPVEVSIKPSNSFFVVTGAPKEDGQQPFVTIKLDGEINYQRTKTSFLLQTSVSQRMMDF